MILIAALLSLLAGACGEIEFEMSVDAAVNETVFMERAALLAQQGRALSANATSNATNTTQNVLPLLVMAQARFNVSKTVSVLCIDSVGCFNDLTPNPPTPAPPPPPDTETPSPVGIICGVTAVSLLIIASLVAFARKPPPPKRTLRIRLDWPRNRGWTMG